MEGNVQIAGPDVQCQTDTMAERSGLIAYLDHEHQLMVVVAALALLSHCSRTTCTPCPAKGSAPQGTLISMQQVGTGIKDEAQYEAN